MMCNKNIKVINKCRLDLCKTENDLQVTHHQAGVLKVPQELNKVHRNFNKIPSRISRALDMLNRNLPVIQHQMFKLDQVLAIQQHQSRHEIYHKSQRVHKILRMDHQEVKSTLKAGTKVGLHNTLNKSPKKVQNEQPVIRHSAKVLNLLQKLSEVHHNFNILCNKDFIKPTKMFLKLNWGLQVTRRFAWIL
uniref:TOD1/MUCI70 glycosyltransferase-like domain-containing protein n=1 Tax=Clytia hemisphaerica TaxID=252671 RepID=A0A7M5V3C8_9CNID